MDEQQKNLIDIDETRRLPSLLDTSFRELVDRVHFCRLCPRMEGRTRVFGPANGPLDTPVLFVAEAPGRLGADRSGVPLTGDQTGRNFDLLLQSAGLTRTSIFITNAVLCNPRDMHGCNSPPTSQEIVHCSKHLQATISLIQPRYVITLGQVALRALQYITKHEVALSRDVGRPQRWNDRWLIALYHPGPRARLHRPFSAQLEDFRYLGDFIKHDMLSSPRENLPSL